MRYLILIVFMAFLLLWVSSVVSGWRWRELPGILWILISGNRRELKRILARRRQAVRGHGTLSTMTYTTPAQAALSLAQQESQELGHGYLGVTHLLLGLAGTLGTAQEALTALSVDHAELRRNIAARMGTNSPHSRNIAYTSRAQQLLSLARTEAGGNDISTGHLLLALIDPQLSRSDGAQVLGQYVSPARVRDKVRQLLTPAEPESARSKLARLASTADRLERETDILQKKLTRTEKELMEANTELRETMLAIMDEN
jgi:ATP-dependent Clp protease ATP-binding subunit ClpA